VPKLEAFPSVSQGWVNKIAAISTAAVKDGIEAGAEYMRKAINNRPTGTKWHRDKNDANPEFAGGARIGNKNPNFGTQGVDPNSGLMLASVSTIGPVVSGAGSQVQGFFGWVDNKESYFLLQDIGNYGVGYQSGMGLLNIARNPTEFVTQMGAKIEAESSVARSMLAAGFKYSGSTF